MKEIKITSSAIKQAIDNLLNESELLQDKVYKQQEEIERLNNIIKKYEKMSFVHEIDLQQRVNKAIEYIEEKYDYILKDDTFLDHDERIDRKQLLKILEILKGE